MSGYTSAFKYPDVFPLIFFHSLSPQGKVRVPINKTRTELICNAIAEDVMAYWADEDPTCKKLPEFLRLKEKKEKV
jgi:hypothetical protein